MRFLKTLAAKSRACRRPLASLRAYADLHRGLLLSAPVFWAAFTVFLNAASGIIGFCLHAALCFPRGKKNRTFLILAYPLLLFWFAWHYPNLSSTNIPFHFAPRSSESIRFHTGFVDNFPNPNARGYSFPLRTETGLVLVSLPETIAPPRLGAEIILVGQEDPPDAPANPGERDSRRVLRAQGALAFLSGESWKEIQAPPFWKKFLAWGRVKLGESLRRHIPRSVLPLVAGSLLNDTQDIPTETQQAFLRSGMQHILAISGQHIALLVTFLLFVGLWIRLPRKAAFLFAAVLTAVYIPLVGSPPSVARAGIMLACFLPSLLLDRPSSGLNVFCVSISIDLLLHPFYILNLGFQLSYAATFALILCAKPSAALAKRCGAWHAWLGHGAQMIFLSTMVTLFTYPILAAATHALSPWSVLGNLVTVPLSEVMLLGGLLVWSFSPLPLLADWAGACTGLCSLLLDGCVHFLARLPGALWSIAEPSAFWLWCFTIGVLALVFIFRAGAWRFGILIILCLCAAETFRVYWIRCFEPLPRVTFLSVGHGDAAVLELPGAVFMIDAGPTPRVTQQVVLPFLRSRGIQKIDALFLTHPDLDHFGGAFGLLGNIPVTTIVGPPTPASAQSTWKNLQHLARRFKIPWQQGHAGQRLYQRGDVALWMLGPDSSLDSAADNNRSLVCLLTTSQGKVLFTGDIEGPAQQALASTWPLWHGAWLKAPHHGSDRTTLPCFLAAVDPPQVTISSGHRPGFPGKNTMQLLQQLGSNVGVTARDGALIWTFGKEKPRHLKFGMM